MLDQRWRTGRSVLFEHESYQAALARLQADPQAWADYRAETRQVAEGGVEVLD